MVERITYDSGAFSHDVPTELARLRALEQAADPQTIAVLSSLGVGRDWVCAEVGAGAGSIARWLASSVPDGRVLATDLDTGWLVAGPGLEVLRHDVVTQDLPADGYRLIHCRALLTHLPDREQIIERLVASLAPGGWLVVEDPCILPSLRPETAPAYRRLVRQSAAFMAAAVGTDLLWPPDCRSSMERAGLEQLSATSAPVAVERTGPGRDVFRSTFDQVVPSAVAHGFVDQGDVDAVRALLADPDFTHPYLDMVATWGRRPVG
jgi:hypothetical protein